MDTKEALEILRQNPVVQALKQEFSVPYRNVFVAIMALHPEDPTRILVVDYKPNWQDKPLAAVHIKFPGGTGSVDDDTPFHTLTREGREELTGGTPGALIEGISPVCKEVKSTRSASETDHVRYGVVVQTTAIILPYTVREGRHVDERGRVTDEEISNHRYLDVGELARVIFPTHRGFLRALCKILAPHIPGYGWALQDLDRVG